MSAKTFIILSFALMLGLNTGAAVALTPIPPCMNEYESGMGVDDARTFGHAESGFIVEEYRYLGDPAPADLPKALTRFYGGRVVDCRSGKIVAVNHKDQEEINAALSATEFLRAAVQGEKRIRFNDVQRAAKAVFGEDVMVLRETEETCGCNAYFPGLRPSSLAPYQQD